MKTRIFDLERREWVKEYVILGDEAYRIVRDSYGAFQSSDEINGKIEYCMDRNDKHGTIIYEGDELKIDEDEYYGEDTGVVGFGNGTFTVGSHEFWDDGNNNWYGVENMWEEGVEILGNIYGVKYNGHH